MSFTASSGPSGRRFVVVVGIALVPTSAWLVRSFGSVAYIGVAAGLTFVAGALASRDETVIEVRGRSVHIRTKRLVGGWRVFTRPLDDARATLAISKDDDITRYACRITVSGRSFDIDTHEQSAAESLVREFEGERTAGRVDEDAAS